MTANGSSQLIATLDTILLEDRFQQCANLLVRFAVHILAVEPVSLFGLESRARLAHALQREGRNQLVHREQLLLGTRVPAQQSQHIDKRLGEVAILTIAARHLAIGSNPTQGEHGEAKFIAITFAQLTLASRFQKQRQVTELGHSVSPTQRTIEQIVQGQRRQPLFATDNVRNLHQVVIHDVCQVIGRQSVCRFIKNFIVQSRGIDSHITTNHIVHLNILTLGHFETDNVLVAACDALLNLLGRQTQRGSEFGTHSVVVSKGLALGLHLGTQSIQLVGSIESIVGVTALHELQSIFFVDCFALALAIRCVGATLADTLIDFDTTPFERLHNILLGSGNEALRVGILDTQDEFTAFLASKQIVIQRGTNAADMQCTSRTGSKTNSNRSCHKLMICVIFVISLQRQEFCVNIA